MPLQNFPQAPQYPQNPYYTPPQGPMIGDVEAYGPYTAYARSVGLGGQGYLNPAQRYQNQMYDPLRWLWGAQQPIYAAAGAVPEGSSMFDWNNYINQFGGGNMGNILGGAQNTLQMLFGMTPQRREEQGLTYEPTYDPMTGETNYAAGSQQQLADLLQMGLAQKFGPYGAAHLAGRLPDLEQQWMLGQASSGISQTFLDYLRQKYGF